MSLQTLSKELLNIKFADPGLRQNPDAHAKEYNSFKLSNGCYPKVSDPNTDRSQDVDTCVSPKPIQVGHQYKWFTKDDYRGCRSPTFS